MSLLKIKIVPTKPFSDQKPGTSGLRKRVNVFQQENYTENFIQATLDAVRPEYLILGGDGRYFSGQAVSIITSICAANGIKKLLIAQNGILSTPSASCLVRKEKADGAIILTASHNPGGIDGDFGIKYNINNGGPAPEFITNKIYELSKSIKQFKTVDLPSLDISRVGRHEYEIEDSGRFVVEVVDPIDSYTSLMRDIFDFDKIKRIFDGPKPIKILIDPMHGVVGPYARRILIDELGAPLESLINYIPLEDFGGGHPDPNLTYAHELVSTLIKSSEIDLGVAFDGDGDRNMILGSTAFFVTPSDSMAVIGANLHLIPHFLRTGIKGFARSMPTAPAIDRVADKMGKSVYETPTGWKFFGNLLDTDKISLCGEESFGTGSDHIREKDGLWACLAWLQIMAEKGKPIKDIVEEHWSIYGRDYFSRYDYEECDASRCNQMMQRLEDMIKRGELNGKQFGDQTIEKADNFEYTDVTDGSITSNQGLRILFSSGDRIVVRLSGTGSCGATVRLYISSYSSKEYKLEAQKYLEPLIALALDLIQLKEFTGREKPTVIT